MLKSNEIHLFIDDSVSRDLNQPSLLRNDTLDYFALGGILVLEEDINSVKTVHAKFCTTWKIDYPLHSWAIRGGRGKFGWLKKPELAADFYDALETMIISLPVIGIAAVIDRPGYFARYEAQHNRKPWLLCKTAYCILIERAAKYARSQNRKLRVFFERAGKLEDKNLIKYARELKTVGMPFQNSNLNSYLSLTAVDFKEIVQGEPRGKTKDTPMIQLAHLLLYPMAKGGYDPEYRPYKKLLAAHKLIDTHVNVEQKNMLGIKYCCFDYKRTKALPKQGF